MDRVAFDEMIATQDTHWWFRGKRRIVACMIKWLALPYDSRILEIGCGTGGNIETLSRYGRVWALELDDYALDYAARTNSGATIEKGWLPDGLSAVSGREFDVICLLDVLEHVKDDEESLRRIGDLCVGKTKVLITTPAYQWLYSRHDKNLGHQRRYSRKDLCGKLTRNGYDVIYSGYLNV
ncbi:MAG: class I SAM-dependent methyltransferase, partial [Synergistaceae bacterium]|nr:class I SAM-dependent methyltransferase [Synergistaceae bacterium]